MTPYYADDLVTIYHGDCREWMPQADVLVTDPPYGISWKSTKKWGASWAEKVIANDGDVQARDAVLRWWGDRPAIVFGSWKRPRPHRIRAVLIWDKGPQTGMGDLRFPWKDSHEEVYVLGSGFVGRRDESVIKGYGPVTWESAGRRHPNEKPVALMRYLVNKCPPGTILDPFMGAGSTLVAAKSLNRKAIGIELEERYCEAAALRCSQETLGLTA